MSKWNLDPNHSSAIFEVRHMMATWVTGRFNKVSGGTIEINREDFGITANRVIENGGFLVGKQLFGTVTAEATLGE